MNELLDIFSLDFAANLQGPMLLIALAGIGLVVGMLTGLFGVGGGFLINPLLFVVMGMPETLVVGSSLTFMIGTASAGTARHLRMKNVEVKTMLLLIVGALPGVLLGKTAHTAMRETLGDEYFGEAFRVFYLIVLLATAWVLYGHSGRDHKGKSVLQRISLGPDVDLSSGELKGVSLVGLITVGVLIGSLTGLLGIGGGVLFVPLLLVVVGLNTHLAVGTSLGVVLSSSIFGAILYGYGDNVNLLVVMALLVGSGVGVQIGAWLCPRLHAKQLQRYFVYIVLLASVLVAVDLAWKLLQT